MTGAAACVALDAGTATAKLAVDDESAAAVVCPASGGDWRARVSGAFAAAGRALPAESLCLAVPEAWLDGSVDGTTVQESLRYACVDELGVAGVTWVGQLAAVAALIARQRGSGRYLVCDTGATGVRTAALDVAGPVIRVVAADSAIGAGWSDFDASIRALAAGGGDPLPADWYRSAREQDRPARAVLSRAATSPGYRESPAYMFTGRPGDRGLLAGQVIDCFAPTAQRIRAGAARALRDGPADVAVLTGGLGWFPLASVVLAEEVGLVPVVADPDAAARGALLFARAAVRMAPPPTPGPVALPVHRIADGELEELSLVLPWSEPFASLADGLPVLEQPVLAVDVAGQRVTVEVPGLVPGPCRIGVRPGWSGACALVVRPADGGMPVVADLGPRAPSR